MNYVWKVQYSNSGAWHLFIAPSVIVAATKAQMAIAAPKGAMVTHVACEGPVAE